MTHESKGQSGLEVHPVTSAEGQAALLGQGLTTAQLKRAVAAYQATENVRVGTWIGIHPAYGFFFSAEPGWDPEDPEAFASPIGNIPWVQIHELLGNLPEGTTADYLDSNGTMN
jgi:hypothetical protein